MTDEPGALWRDIRVTNALKAAHDVGAAAGDSRVDDLLTAIAELEAVLAEKPIAAFDEDRLGLIGGALRVARSVVELAGLVGDDRLGQAARHLAATLEVRLNPDGATVGDVFLYGDAALEPAVDRAAQLIYEAHMQLRDGRPWSELTESDREPYRVAVRGVIAPAP